MKITSQFLAATALAAALVSAITSAHAQSVPACKSMADPCWSGKGAVAGLSAQITPGWQRVGKTNIFITGKTADGKYNVYNIEGEIDDLKYFVGNTVYTANDMIKFLDGIPDKEDGKNGIRCETICKNAKGQVIGVLNMWKKMNVGAKKK